MVTKRNKLVYKFDSVIADGTIIDIDMTDLLLPDGNTFDSAKCAGLVDTIVVSKHNSENGTDRRAAGISIGASGQANFVGFTEYGSGNVTIEYTMTSSTNLRITLNLKNETIPSTDMRVFVDLMAYSQD